MAGAALGMPFERTGPFPVDESLVKTKAEMLATVDAKMPDVYFAICKEDGQLYVYKKSATPSAETGKYSVVEGSGGVTEEYLRELVPTGTPMTVAYNMMLGEQPSIPYYYPYARITGETEFAYCANGAEATGTYEYKYADDTTAFTVTLTASASPLQVFDHTITCDGEWEISFYHDGDVVPRVQTWLDLGDQVELVTTASKATVSDGADTALSFENTNQYYDGRVKEDITYKGNTETRYLETEMSLRKSAGRSSATTVFSVENGAMLMTTVDPEASTWKYVMMGDNTSYVGELSNSASPYVYKRLGTDDTLVTLTVEENSGEWTIGASDGSLDQKTWNFFKKSPTIPRVQSWMEIEEGGTVLPAGGTTDQALIKASDADYDYKYDTVLTTDALDNRTLTPTGWGVAKTGVVQINTPSDSSGTVSVDISDLNLASVDDYYVAIMIVGGTGAWGGASIFGSKTNATSFFVSAYRNGSNNTRVDVSYIVVAKGYGGTHFVDGTGLPVGGTTEQILSKVNDQDGIVQWVNDEGRNLVKFGRKYGLAPAQTEIKQRVASYVRPEGLLRVFSVPIGGVITDGNSFISGILNTFDVYVVWTGGSEERVTSFNSGASWNTTGAYSVGFRNATTSGNSVEFETWVADSSLDVTQVRLVARGDNNFGLSDGLTPYDIRNLTGMVLDDLKVTGNAVPTDWGIATSNVIRVNKSSTDTQTTIDVSGFGFKSANDYQVVFETVGGGNMDWGTTVYFLSAKTATSFRFTARNASSNQDYVMVGYTIFAKGYGNVAMEGGSGVPAGGTTGQVLAKRSNTDGDVEWVNGGGAAELFYIPLDVGDFDQMLPGSTDTAYYELPAAYSKTVLAEQVAAGKQLVISLTGWNGATGETGYFVPVHYRGNDQYDAEFFSVEYPQERIDVIELGIQQVTISGQAKWVATMSLVYPGGSTVDAYTKAETDALLDGKSSFDIATISTAGGGDEVHATVSQDTDTASLNYYKTTELPNALNLNVGSDSFRIPTTGYVDAAVGDLTTLTTTAQTDLVSAINEVKFGLDNLGEPFRVKQWASNTLNVEIPYCTEDIANGSIQKMVYSIDDVEGAEYQIAGMIAYEVFDAASGGNRINCWPVCQFTGNGQKELSVRWMCGGTTRKTAKRISAWVLLKHR